MKIYLDDVRDIPSDLIEAGFELYRNPEDVVILIENGKLWDIEAISFDHDLGDGVMSGYDVLKVIEEHVMVYNEPMPDIRIHSANPVGRRNMEACIAAMRRHLGS